MDRTSVTLGHTGAAQHCCTNVLPVPCYLPRSLSAPYWWVGNCRGRSRPGTAVVVLVGELGQAAPLQGHTARPVTHTSPSPIKGICSHPKVLSNNTCGDHQPLSVSYDLKQGTESQTLAKGPNPAAAPDKEWAFKKQGRGEGEMSGEMAGAFPAAEFSLTMSAVFQSKYFKRCLLRFIYLCDLWYMPTLISMHPHKTSTFI